MTNDEITLAIYEVVEEMRPTDSVPNPKTRGKTSTGRLANDALKCVRNGNVVTVYVDEKIAPYMPYTNEPWLSPIWNGKKNPNEGWWERFAQELAKRLADKLGGVIKNV